ncbi:hypothetical protein [Myroides odoratimimus]|uniref:DUF4292 domain-containing protein n=1 Tax=Myroides odoratimimus CIP 101113 TaxID=883154 RepID=A0AAV3F857_9FLAO|nr:hypothetical protein [Myroides odoratimimus]EHO15538.1 hypothetical protein HMPREF9715_00109 [Myroides odoratimimus CIP 101113]
MIRVLLISLCAFLAVSCKSIKLDYIYTDNFITQESVIENSYFATLGEEHIFRANMTVFKHELSGLLVVKRMDENQHRVVMTSDFGNTLFDFSIYSDRYVVNYVMSDIDKKLILNILAKDFQLFTAVQLPVKKLSLREDDTVFLGRYNKLETVVFWDNALGRVSRLVYGTPKKAKVSYNYVQSEHDKPILSIEHYNFPMRIKLTPMTEE